MKIAVLGTGRTGGKVLELLKGQEPTAFNELNPPTLEKLAGYDAIIVFLPGPIFVPYIDMLVESELPVVNASTGFDWPDNINERLKKQGSAWITASNFSLGMNLVHGMIKVLGKAPKLFDDYRYNLHEIHHIHKQDSPSGTALSWQKWLDQPVAFSHEREGDNPGDHRLTLATPYENIIVQHQSKDRRIFAEGAIWTAKKLITGTVPAGLHDLSDIMVKELDI